MKHWLGVVALSALACRGTGPDPAQSYEIWIRGGTVVDGTGAEPRVADIVIADDAIVYLGDVVSGSLDAELVIDAGGKVVTPGFIDPHSHGDPLTHPFDNFVAQGVTTVVLGQDGRTPGFSAQDEEPMTLEAWMRAVEETGTRTNIATLVGHGTIRQLAGAGSNKEVRDGELERMNELLERGLDAGAFGMSSGLEYVPGRNAPVHEVMSLARTVGENDAVIMSHVRSEDGAVMDPADTEAVLMRDALEEVIAQGEHARVHVAHIKVVYGKGAEEGEEILARLREARASGVEISADVYPYLAGMSNFYFLYPIWAREREVFEDAVANNRDKLAEDMSARVEWRGGADKALIASGEYTNMNVAEVAEKQGKHYVDVIIDWGYGGPSTAHFTQNADLQDAFITAPDVAIGTDGSPTMRHPRSYGTYPKIIQEYVVEKERIPLEVAVRKMSGLPAEILRLDDRGTLAVGNKADVLVLEPEAVKATATWAEPRQFPEGFDYVLVNGRVAVASGEIASQNYGKVLRKERNHE